MRPDPRFLRQPKSFWAYVRFTSQQVGYTVRGRGQVRVPTFEEIRTVLREGQLEDSRVACRDGRPTALGRALVSYFEFRASALNGSVEPKLMDARDAAKEFRRLRKTLRPKCPLPMNKQKGSKRVPAYLTGIVNMIIEANAPNLPCDYDPRALTILTRDGAPLRTLARRIDGAFPSTLNPIAVWEVKEYYHTTTFGSRVADGVYETLLDGMELEEAREHEGVHVKHYLIIDSHYTWWECGRSYLCRIVDMLHMGYVDEVLFGREVLERLPRIVREWVAEAHSR